MQSLTPIPLDHRDNVTLLFLKMPENSIFKKVSTASIHCQLNPELTCHNCVQHTEEKQQNIIIMQQKLIYGVCTYISARIPARFKSF